MLLRARWAVCAALSALSLGITACGGGGEKTTQELIDDLLAAESREQQVEIADQLAARANPDVVRTVSSSAGSEAALPALRDSLIRVYRSAPNAPATRTKAVRSVAAAGDEPSTTFVISVVGRDRNPAVRKAATGALVEELGQRDAVPRLITAHDRGGRGQPQIDEALVAIGIPAARQLFRRLSDDAWVRGVVRKIGKPASPFLRRELARGGFDATVDASRGILAVGAGRDVQRVVSKMMEVLGGPNDSRRFTAIEILAAAGRPTVDAIVPIMRRSYESLDVVGKKQWEWGIQLLVDTKNANPRATRHLFAALRNKEYDLVADIHMFYVRLGRAGTESGLIDALDAEGDTIMALNFLNSGNPKLDRGARAWAAAHGYTVTSSPGPGAPVSWGSG